MRWLLEAASQDHQASVYLLADHFLGIYGSEPDVGQEWLRRAADKGIANAQYRLGVLYSSDRYGVRRDEEAVPWYRKAAEQGHCFAMYDLGGMYAAGRGVPRDQSLAMEWFRKSRDHGNLAVSENLARWPKSPTPVMPNFPEATLAEDFAALLVAVPCAWRIQCIERAYVSSMHLRLDLHLSRAYSAAFRTLICVNAVDYSIRPRDPTIYMGPAEIWMHEKHELLEASHLQLIPEGDGEVFRPPLDLKVLMLGLSYVIAERFELRPWIA